MNQFLQVVGSPKMIAYIILYPHIINPLKANHMENQFGINPTALMLPCSWWEDSLDCIPWGSDESLDDETFEARMDVHESGDAPLPDPAPHHHVANPNDPANMDTLPSDPSEWGAVLGGPDRPSPDSPPEVAVEYIDARIAYLQSLAWSSTCVFLRQAPYQSFTWPNILTSQTLMYVMFLV